MQSEIIRMPDLTESDLLVSAAPRIHNDRSACVRIVSFYFCKFVYTRLVSRTKKLCRRETFPVARAGKPACDFTSSRHKRSGEALHGRNLTKFAVKGVNTLREGRAHAEEIVSL